MLPEEFTRLNERFYVEWEDIGEGRWGDYDETDPEDTPLLRFSCYEKVDGEWVMMEDASYCTRMPVGTPDWILDKARVYILSVLDQDNYKSELEFLSWMSPDEYS